ncbi:MAG: YncE family protein [Spirochaetes bacterium]|nr:YncE family protein [Spirochaetota bacterium]
MGRSMGLRSLVFLVFVLEVASLYGGGQMVLEQGKVMIRTFPPEAELYRGEERLFPVERRNEWRTYLVPKGFQVLTLQAPGYLEKKFHLDVSSSLEIEEKLERRDSKLHLLGETPTGRWPKGVLFHPNQPVLLVTLLGGLGIDCIQLPTLILRKTLRLESSRQEVTGFVEFCTFPKRGEIWVSQMLTNEVHILEAQTLKKVGTVQVQGVWPKVICTDREERYAYVSNWESKSVSVIETATRRVIHVIPVTGIPRGLAITRRGILYVCLYDPGDLDVIDTKNFMRIKTLPFGPGAKRHIVLDEEKDIAYVSDMATGRIIKFSIKTDQPLASLWVGSNPNTLALTKDGHYLFVSIRGRNNPEDYQKKGPEFGKILVIDTEAFTIADWVWGRNQPTGLTLSPDNRYLAFTDFLDDNLEVYEISQLYEP